jgi:hypothetical protein
VTVTVRRLIAGAGIVGAVMLGVYFTVPAFVPRLGALVYSSRAPTAQIVAVGRDYRLLLSFGRGCRRPARSCALFS